MIQLFAFHPVLSVVPFAIFSLLAVGCSSQSKAPSGPAIVRAWLEFPDYKPLPTDSKDASRPPLFVLDGRPLGRGGEGFDALLAEMRKWPPESTLFVIPRRQENQIEPISVNGGPIIFAPAPDQHYERRLREWDPFKSRQAELNETLAEYGLVMVDPASNSGHPVSYSFLRAARATESGRKVAKP